MYVKTEKQIVKVLKESLADTCLLFFPFVGANWSVFTPILKNLKGDFGVLSINPPGHAGDSAPLLDSIEDMATLYMEELEPYLKKNLIICGYSLGCLVTYSILKKIEERKALNITVILAASIPPHLIGTSRKIGNLHNDQIIQFFHSIGGIPTALLKERELLELYLPILKADYRAFETYETEIKKLDYPCFLIYGKADNFVGREEFLEWEKYFKNPPVVYYINGGHLFIRDNAIEFASIIQNVLDTIYNSQHLSVNQFINN